MATDFHVMLPDEIRAYVDLRTTGESGAYETPSDYIGALIRHDMERESELYVLKELLKSTEDIKAGTLISSAQLHANLDDMFAGWNNDADDSATVNP
jgi:antitoxin ParD1/3/4